MNDYIIETHNLTKKYGSQTSVSHLNIHVKKGRIYGLLGRNGAGKTTLFRLIMGLETPDSGEFEDRATLMAVARAFLPSGAVDYTTGERDGMLVVETPALRLTYDRKPFSKEGLTIVVKGVPDSQFNTWHYGDDPKGNLGGTARTLDEADGAIPLGQGVISRDGWAVLDDSASNVFVTADADGNLPDGVVAYGGIGVAPRDHRETDIYFFGYGRRYREAVHDFQKLSGPAPLLPRYALGNWWSRYYRYSEEEYLDLMDRFKREGIPFTTSVIDMDWHLVDDVDPKYGSGWTGYTWNKDFFPDPKRFLNWLHEHGMKATLNVHPRDGVRAFEELYPQVAKAMNIDPESGEAVQFDLTDPKFMEVYFDQLHHPMEEDGVDFWWIDWQQGGLTRQPGLDPLWGLNHLHYLDSARNDGSDYSERNPRPLTFSRYAGPGSHRYPIGFSGDTVVTWESLKFQPEFTACASNIGYGWWSHDIGGHMFGYRDEELEVRWYQLGAFSPINRLHSTDSPFNGKEPWNFHGDAERAMTSALRLRHAMIPYLYTMNRRAAFATEPLVQPLYWDYPEIEAAYKLTDEFRFGTELLVAPIVDPAERSVQRAKADVWLPQGEWFDFFDGRHYTSRPAEGRRLEAWRDLDRMPVFAKPGAIVPLQMPAEGEALNSVANPRALQVVVFPGAENSFTLWEDDGAAQSKDRWASTEMALRFEGDSAQFSIAPTEGATDVIPASRDWTVTFRGIAPEAMHAVRATVDGSAAAPEVAYDAETLSLTVTLRDVPTSAAIAIDFADGLAVADDPVEADAFAVMKDAQMLYMTKEHAYRAIRELGKDALPALSTLEDLHGVGAQTKYQSHMPQPVIQALAEVLTRN